MENNFGLFLKEARKKANLTQKELSEKLFISESAVSKWEKGVSNPDISMIPLLSSILGVSEHELITASVDNEERAKSKDAKKWRTLSGVWDFFFIISYGVTLLTCFIVNLAVSGNLTWFFIVLSALLLSESFTTIPKFIKKYKLLFIPLIELASLIILFAVCCIYTGGKWFILATVPCIVSYVIIFLPIIIDKYKFSQIISKHNAIISVIVDYLFLLGMLAVINGETNGSWFGFAFIMTTFEILQAIFIVCVCRYTKLAKLIKASLITLFYIPYSVATFFLTKVLCKIYFNEKIDNIGWPNIFKWNTDLLISSNVCALILLSLLLTSIILFVIHKVCKKHKSS